MLKSASFIYRIIILQLRLFLTIINITGTMCVCIVYVWWDLVCMILEHYETHRQRQREMVVFLAPPVKPTRTTEEYNELLCFLLNFFIYDE